MQTLILAGGLGTRMRPLTDTCPKTLLPVCGRPFAYHQLHWLASQGVGDVIYCIGHQGEMIRRYWESEPAPVRSIRYVDEGEKLRGTGGALRLAHQQGALDESFLVIYGDSFLPVEFTPVWRAFHASELPALMTVLRNEGRWDRSNVSYREGRILRYDKVNATPDMQHIDYGLGAFNATAFNAYPAGRSFDLVEVYQDLLARNQLAAYEVSTRFYEIGGPAGLEETRQHLS